MIFICTYFVDKSSEENVTESVNVKPQQSSKLGHQQILSDQRGLHVKSSDVQQQVTSEAQVKEDIKKLYENFASVVTNVKVKLAVFVENELSKLTQITQYIEKHYQLSHLAEIKDVNELFDSISSHYCFLNSCDLIKRVVEEFLSGDEVHSELTQYLKDLDTFKMSTQLRYIKTAIKEVLLQNQDVTETSCTVSIKLNEIWGCTTLKKFENFICLTFGKNFNYLNQLCTELGKECFCVTFVMPLSKLEFLIDKVLPQKEFIQIVGIIEMSVNNDIIISPDETAITNLEQCFLEFAETGNQFGISTLLELGVDVDYKSSEGRTALMIASYAGHQQCVQMLTSANVNVDIQDNKGYTALMLATECNSIDIISHLLSVNASVNLQTQEDDTALTMACRNCLFDIVKLLLDYKADPLVANYKALLVSTATEQHNDILVQMLKYCPGSKYDLTEVLSVACLNGQPQIIATLLQHIDTTITSEQIQITMSCARGDYSTVEKYINHSNVDVNYRFLPPLIIASSCGHISIVNMLLKQQANVSIETQSGLTSLMAASKNGHCHVAEILQKYASADDINKLCFSAFNSAHYSEAIRLLPLVSEPKSIHTNVCDTNIPSTKGNRKYFDPKDSIGLLHLAAWNGWLDIMKTLIDKYEFEPEMGEHDIYILHIAVLNKHIDVIKYLISECGCDPMCKDNDGWICLDYAAKCESVGIMKYLIGSPCLHIAVLHKHIDVVKYLISEHGCDPMCKDNNGWTCLHYAGECGSLDIMKYLITECKCDPMAADNDGSTCLHIATGNKHIDVVKYLIRECGCDPTCKNDNGWTCLHYTGQCGSLDIMKYLITECQCDPMVTNKYGSTCLHIAALNKHIDVVKYLFSECGCDPMCKDNDGWTCLDYAAKCGSLDVMNYLITECQCDPMVTNKYGSTCLHIAVLNKHFDVVKYLISECGCDPMCKDNDGWTCLHYAGACGILNVMNYLITECQCDPKVADKNGSTCLHIAASNKHFDVVKYLISECGCDPMRKNNNGWICLHYAGQCGSLDIMKYLIIECNCDSMVSNKSGSTCLHIAVFHKHIDVVKYLISECGCDPMCKDNDGWTCLHYAGKCGSLDIMKYLITECKCDPMVTNNDGSTCLHIAVVNRHLSLTEYLLSTNKINPFARNNYYVTAIGQCPFDKALRNVFTKFSEVKISHPVDSFVNVLLLGNSGAGKSTLAKVITERAVSTAWFGQFRNVQGVEPYTAGIIPTKLTHHELGNIILYDFAGHPEYYTSHTAVIKNLLQGSAAVFVIVVNIMEEEATKHLQQWLTIVTNEVSKTLKQCHIIVAVSHVDEIMDRVTSERKQIELQQIIKERCDTCTSVSIKYLDCRKLGGSNVTSLFSNMSSACQSIRNTIGRNLSLYCHMMYGLLEESKQNILSLSDIISIAETSDQYIVPKDEEEILEIISSLELIGLIALLKSSNKVWVVFNKQILLTEVNGILFAPKSFKQYCDIASNTGIITVSDLTQLFPNYDPDMLICFLKNMALCQEVNPQLFEMTNLVTNGRSDDKERFLFFPTLLNVDRPDNIDQEVFLFGWCLQCTEHYHFFPSHFLHSLLLNLSYKYALPKHTSTLNIQSNFWKNGIHWFNGNGVALVELVDESQCVLVLMSCEEGYESEMVFLRRNVITEIMKLQKKSYPNLMLSAFVIDPQDLTYPIDKPTQRTVYNVQDIIYCIIHRKDFVTNSKVHSSNYNCVKKKLNQLLFNESLQLENIGYLSILGERYSLISKNVHIAGEKQFHIQKDTPQLLNWEKYGLKINVQEEAVPKNAKLTASALVGGVFVFPKNTQLVSAVYSISVSKPLLKPLRLEMQHCVYIQSPDDTKYLKFAVASVDIDHGHSNPSYEFVPVDGGKFTHKKWYGSIEHKKFFLICILYEFNYEACYKTATIQSTPQKEQNNASEQHKERNGNLKEHEEHNGKTSGNSNSVQKNSSTSKNSQQESTDQERAKLSEKVLKYLMKHFQTSCTIAFIQ